MQYVSLFPSNSLSCKTRGTPCRLCFSFWHSWLSDFDAQKTRRQRRRYPALRELGLDALELGWVNAVRVTEQTCAEIRAAGQEQEVAISVHAPYFINLNADDEEWPKSRKRLMDAAHYGNLAGATDIIFHPGSYFGRPPEEVLPKAIERLQGCVEELRAAGNPVILRPETMGKSAMLGSLEDTLEMSRSIPGVKPCLDFAHLHARPGDGTMNTYDEWASVLDAYGKRWGGKARPPARPSFRDRIRPKGGEGTPASGRGRPGFEGPVARSARFRLRRAHPVRKPGDGRRRIKMQRAWAEVAGG